MHCQLSLDLCTVLVGYSSMPGKQEHNKSLENKFVSLFEEIMSWLGTLE
jgi:hypothetical protein